MDKGGIIGIIYGIVLTILGILGIISIENIANINVAYLLLIGGIVAIIGGIYFNIISNKK